MTRDVRTPTLTAAEVAEVRRSRRHPRRTQFDYLHLRYLNRDLAAVLGALRHPVERALDVYCGARPYDDLFPGSAELVGLDVVGNPYGVADVVSDEFLPFPDAAFDLVACIEAFHYVADADAGVAELRRVLRPGGTLLISVPFVWEYDRTMLERRYTGPELADLLAGWDEVRVVENGGRAVAWATLSGLLLRQVELRLPRVARRPFRSAYWLLNAAVAPLARLEERAATGTAALPMNLLATARRPLDG